MRPRRRRSASSRRGTDDPPLPITGDRSDKAYEWWLNASDKLDYFVAGVALALVGYLASTFRPEPLGLDPKSVELVAILAILGSAILALKRIEATVVLLKSMHTHLASNESVGKLTIAASKGEPLINERTGEIMDPGSAIRKAKLESTTAAKAGKHYDRWAARARGLYAWRNRLLFGGIFGILVARVWSAYKR